MNLASRGLRDMGEGLERLAPDDLVKVREQARRVHRRALMASLVYAAVTLLLP
ncbi:MAG: hypothetical protein AMXMBFR53_21970 [Gemmatimonadota bacterium]